MKKKIGILCDNYKVEKYVAELNAAGIEIVSQTAWAEPLKQTTICVMSYPHLVQMAIGKANAKLIIRAKNQN